MFSDLDCRERNRRYQEDDDYWESLWSHADRFEEENRRDEL